MQDIDTSKLDDTEQKQLVRVLEQVENADSKSDAIYFDEESRKAISGIRKKITT